MPRLWVAFPSNSLPVVWARLAQHRFRVVEVIDVGMGQMELPPFRAGILDLGPLRLGIQAILGVNVLAGRRLQVDFPEGRLYLLQ
jgi:hypothetical protein